MAYVITEACISCGACESECPSGCITPGAELYQIDENCCIDCGSCSAVCPVDAPQPN